MNNNNCVIYARFSSHGQNEQSIESQVRTCKEFADSKGYTVIGVYSDKAKTGTNDKRPDFQRMMKDAQSGTFGYIIVYMMDRFSRNRRDSIMYKEMLKEKFGIKVVSALEHISDDEGGEFYEMFLEWNAEKYSKRLSKRIRDGIDTSIKNGTYCGGKLMYGYRLIDTEKTGKKGIIHKVEINEEEAEVVRFIFESCANGIPKKKIAEKLNEKGYRFNGKKFTFRMFEHWLVNEKYTGEFTFGGRVCTNVYPQIIDKALFQRVQDKLSEKRYVSGGENTAKVPYILTGKVFCGYCGKHINGDSGTSHSGKRKYYYNCANRKKNKNNCKKKATPKDELEQIVLDMAMDLFTSKVNLDIICDEIMRVHEKNTAEQSVLHLLQTEKAKSEKSMKNILTAIEEGIINATTKSRMSELEAQIDELNAKIHAEEYKLQNGIKREDVMEYLTHSVRDLSPQVLIDVMVHRIELYDDEIVVWFNYSDRINPDDPDTDSRDFILREIYFVTVTAKHIIAKKKI